MPQRAGGPTRAPDSRPALAGPLGVVVVDSRHVVRSALALLISAQRDMQVLAEAHSADAAMRAIRGMRRGTRVLVLVGQGLTGEHDGFWLVRAIRERHPHLQVLGCGVNGDATVVSRALFAGADGYVDQCADPRAFFDALRRAAAGETVLEGVPPGALGEIVGAIEREADQWRRPRELLTEREREVLCLASHGLTARQIARRLGISERTITTHLDHIYRKLGVSCRVAAIREGTRLGLVSGVVE